MLYSLLTQYGDGSGIFNLARYLTFRTGASIITALIICFIIGPAVIRWLKKKQKKGQPIREDGPESHILAKAGTPTMGGFMILFALSMSTFLWADLENAYVWMVILVTASFGLIGFIDDYFKVTQSSSAGLSGRVKLLIEFAIAGLIGFWILEFQEPIVALPFIKTYGIDLGWLYIPFLMVFIAGFANAVNLTDGLDGLAIVPVIMAGAAFGFIAYMVGNSIYSDYLGVFFVPGTGELAIFAGALIGAGLGFLWFNAPPAMVFMGDTGSLALGGAIGTMAAIAKHELVLVIVGGLFVVETLSVILQVGSFKLTGRRIFRMAPLHHHYEKKGWAEPTIVIRFWIVAFVLALIGLATLKIR